MEHFNKAKVSTQQYYGFFPTQFFLLYNYVEQNLWIVELESGILIPQFKDDHEPFGVLWIGSISGATIRKGDDTPRGQGSGIPFQPVSGGALFERLFYIYIYTHIGMQEHLKKESHYVT